MAVKKGQFVSKNGHTYEVRLSGTSVEGGDILLGVPPVTISMAAGEHKFCGFKSTTAIVNILTDVPLLDLYAQSATDIRLTVENITTESIEFDGYVSPFSFDQPYTGKLDSVTINAVDLISARKHMPYISVSEYGVDETGLSIVSGICARAGVTDIQLHDNFKESKGSYQEYPPLSILVAQAGFLQDKSSEVDALSAVCKFFGYTGHIVGRTLYLYDEHTLPVNFDVRHYYTKDGKWYKGSYHYNAEKSGPYVPQTIKSIVGEMSVSVERAYDGVQITPSGSDESVLLPDVCSDNNMTLGSYEEFPISDGVGKILEYRTQRDNAVMDFYSLGRVVDNDWDEAAVPMHVVHLDKQKETISGHEIEIWNKGTSGNYVWVRPKLDTYKVMNITLARQNFYTSYSHTRGLAKLSFDFHISADGSWNDINAKLDAGSNVYKIALLRIYCGEERFYLDYSPDPSYDRWKSRYDDEESSIFLFKEYKLLPTGFGQLDLSGNVALQFPNSGRVSVDICYKGYPLDTDGDRHNIFISKLEMTGYGDKVNTKCAGLLHSFLGKKDELLEVNTLLTSRNSDYTTSGSPFGVNARPGVVTDVEWTAPYNGVGSKTIPIAGVLMEQLKSRYNKPHAAYKMTVDGNIKPYAGVVFNDKTYTVEAYDRDVYNDTTTITID